ncbi:MAG: LLM class flavin-dependent oxidoreductase [Pseudomonadota bacterium]
MHPMRFGLFLLPNTITEATDAAIKAESQGFYSVSVNDHFYSPLGDAHTPQLECFVALTAIAMVTKTITLAPAVIATSFRTPAMLGKLTSCIDIASEGRFICGLGAGWQVSEYETHGYSFPSLKERLEQMDESIQILKAMWTQDSPAFAGKHFRVNEAFNNPRPIQKPHPPIMLGGSGKGLLKIAAREATILNIIPPTSNGKDFPNDPVATRNFTFDVLKERVKLLHQFMREEGRDPQEMELGGLVLLGLSRQKGDANLIEMAKNLGFDDYTQAQAAPVCLLGTPEEVRDMIQKRKDEASLTYYIMLAANSESQDMFVEEVMPHFA